MEVTSIDAGWTRTETWGGGEEWGEEESGEGGRVVIG